MAVLSLKRHLSFSLHLFDRRLDRSKQIAHVSDFLVASKLDLLCEVKISLGLVPRVRLVADEALPSWCEIELDRIGFFLVSMNR